MQASLWIRYLCGQGSAIREVAEGRSALWTGIGLVLLTAIARNYDQTFVGENSFLWLWGPLLFSVVSGTWLYIVVCGWFVRRGTADANGHKPAFWSGWRCFMGLFWMTAPIAWLYAIPVERFLDSQAATCANLYLLGVVSLWRVLLTARVIQHLTLTPWYLAFLWVLLAAAIEVLAVFIFGDGFGKRIMASMGGMRNSPEETLVNNTMATVFVTAFWTTPVVLVLALVLGRNKSCEPLPVPVAATMHWRGLAIAAAIWVGIAIYPQIELAKNYEFERALAGEEYRKALDYLSAHRPEEFAPARPLPPKPFEYSVFKKVPECFNAIQTSDAVCVRVFLINRLDTMMVHYGPRLDRQTRLGTLPPAEQIEHIVHGVKGYGPDADGLLKLLDGLERIPEGQTWLATNTVFLQALQQIATAHAAPVQSDSTPEELRQADWSSLSLRLGKFLTNSRTIRATNLIESPMPAPP